MWISLFIIVGLASSSSCQLNIIRPISPILPAVTGKPIEPVRPVEPSPTPTSTSVTAAISIPVTTPISTSTPLASKPPVSTVAPASPPPQVFSPPPPPGAGSSKTGILSVIKFTGIGLSQFSNDLGEKYTTALADLLGVQSSSIVIRNWQPASRRRSRSLLQTTDSIVVGSLATMGDGILAASGVSSLKADDASGSMQEAFTKAGMTIQSASLQSADTVLPSNFQPIGSNQSRGGLKVWAWILIAVAAVLFILTIALCCCRNLICCCFPTKAEDEKLPNMIKFGAQKDVANPYFYNDQTFTRTNNLVSKQEPQLQASK